jgi:CRP-like cAMP-binding protein
MRRPGASTAEPARNVAGKLIRNQLLIDIPDREYRSIAPRLEFVTWPYQRTLHEPRPKLDYIYFVNSGLVSLVVATRDGRSVQIGVVGREGLVGISTAFGLTRSPIREVFQIPGSGFRIHSGSVRNILDRTPHLHMLLSRYAVLQGLQIAQMAACNRLHNVEQRLARWLLMVQDRIASESLRITHEFLATMLGTDRPSVSLAAGHLQKKEIIRYRRGTLKIISRKKLDACACECYGVMQQVTAGQFLLSPTGRQSALESRAAPKV